MQTAALRQFLSSLESIFIFKDKTVNLLILRVISVHFLTHGNGGGAPSLHFSYFRLPRNPPHFRTPNLTNAGTATAREPAPTEKLA